ncbi:MAG TPA: ATP-dependent DNA helicase, partial [Gammaproteobacteria bacterium]|nr:ATP-dependent DNA helicase [Gammaproteobacteria bacterium]
LSGPFAKTLPGFMPREGQQDLSDVINQVIHKRGTLVAEAGTGIGKTFAYLVPAMLADKKIIISTGTRHLQDQLFHRDLPAVKAALKLTLDAALLKGRANYLCLYRMDLDDHPSFYTSEIRDHFVRIRQWSKTTRSGDIGEMHGISEDARVWPMVTSTAENCLGTECPKWTDCFVVKARRAAQEADMVVINHHLLLADMAIKENGFGELLPSADVFIIDEAHQLPDVASRFFGKTISSRQINNLMSDVVAEQLKDAPELTELRDLADAIKKSAQDFRLALGADNQREAWLKVQTSNLLEQARAQLLTAIAELAAALEKTAERGKGLEQCYGRTVLLKQLLERYGKPVQAEAGELAQEFIYWYETTSRGFMLNMTP